jgi:DNA-binding NarL/FixJ family response regulator
MNWLDHEELALASHRAPDPPQPAPRRLPIRVLVAHDSRLLAEALMFTLETDPMLEPIGYALDGWEAFELVSTLRPDVILAGPELSGLDGLSFIRFVHMVWPQVRIIVLADTQVPHEVEEAYGVGASDYLPNDRSTNELLDAIGSACLRQAAFDRGVHASASRCELVETHVNDDR